MTDKALPPEWLRDVAQRHQMFKRAKIANRPDVQNLLDAIVEYRRALHLVKRDVSKRDQQLIEEALQWKPTEKED